MTSVSPLPAMSSALMMKRGPHTFIHVMIIRGKSHTPHSLPVNRGSPNFHKMGRVKISLIKDFLLLGVSVVISDIDTAWIRNPLPYFNRFPQAHILTSTGEVHGGGAVTFICIADDQEGAEVPTGGTQSVDDAWMITCSNDQKAPAHVFVSPLCPHPPHPSPLTLDG